MSNFNKPTIEDIQLEPDCIETLKAIDAKHEAGNAAANLLAWSPLIFIASNPNPVNIVFTIATTDWEGLTQGAVGLERIKFLSIARDCALEAARHLSDRKLKIFWSAMYDFYRHQADALSFAPTPMVEVDFAGIMLSLPPEVFSAGDAGDFSEFSEIFRSFETEMRSALNMAPDELLIDNTIVEEEVDDDPIPDDQRSGIGLLSHSINGRSYARKRRFNKVATGRTKIRWQGIHSRIVKEYKYFYVYDNPVMFSATEMDTVEAFLVCVGGLALLTVLAVATGYFDPVTFAGIITVCTLLVGVSSTKAMFRVQHKWG